MRNKSKYFNKREIDALIKNDLEEYTHNKSIIGNKQNVKYSENKLKYISELNGEKPIIICTGPTGTGKTYLACQEGIKQLSDYRKILITRPAVSIHNENHGFLPGTLENKMAPWFRPIYDNIEESFGKDYLDYLLKNKIIDMCPFAYIRGRTFNNTFIIADEMQNATSMQFKTLLTRIGYDSKLVINGDISQSDNPANNGLAEFLGCLNRYHTEPMYISRIELETEDIIRHPAVIEILDIYGQ
jgi:phosphate starvation-inducible PhoH-like protein